MSCGTRAQESRPGDPDGAWLLRSSLSDQSLLNFPERASAADAFTGVLLTDCAAARQFIPARPYCLSGLREKRYPPNRRMSTPATIDFSVSEGKVICFESRVRRPARAPPPGGHHALPDRQPSHHRTRRSRPPQPPGNRPGSGQTQGNARSARPRTSSRAHGPPRTLSVARPSSRHRRRLRLRHPLRRINPQPGRQVRQLQGVLGGSQHEGEGAGQHDPVFPTTR
jgi:hypothetical protein